MAIKIGYSAGKGRGGANRGPKGGDGPSYSDGKHSSIAKGISTGRNGSTKVDVGYGAGKKYGGNCGPDPKNHSKPFKPGGRA